MARTSSKIVKSIPNTEADGMTLCYTEPNQSGDKYIISQNLLKGQFTLWKCLEDCFEKVATSYNPLEFDKIIPYKMPQ